MSDELMTIQAQEVTSGVSMHQSQNESLESILIYMQAYGKPRLSKHSSGWHSSIDMQVATIGASFEVASDFTHKTPLEAAIECRKRMNDALDKFGGAK